MSRRRRAAGAALVAAVLGLLATTGPAHAQDPGDGRRPAPEDRYALAGGCYAVSADRSGAYLARSGTGFLATAGDLDDAEAFHLQATDLGRYLLFGTRADHLAAAGSAVVAAPDATSEADWRVDDLGDGTFALRLPSVRRTLTATGDGALRVVDDAAAAGPAARFRFRRTDGCATFPEVQVNVSGPVATGATPYAEVTGFVDPHLHLSAYEFLGGRVHCGRPWHRYGVTRALADCPDHTLADGAGAVVENLLSGGTPLATHDPVGWPTFRDWPAPASLTHEQVYHRWLERSWRAGLRVVVNLLVENRVLCDVYPLKQNPCDEMASAHLQARRLQELEGYIDAQSGGPGEGWFRLVDDPFEARRVANEGKLAVVMGIEVSELFGCRSFLGQPQCSVEDIDRGLDDLVDLGVRQLTVIHKFDNALGGVALDPDLKGNIINGGNLLGTGRFWDVETCDHEDTGNHDNHQSLPGGLHEHTDLLGAVLAAYAPPGLLPIYPPGNHCNTQGLTPLGAHAVEAMIDRGLIVDVDHMSVAARRSALDLLEAAQHSGVISSHSWSTPEAYPRIYGLGGFTAPYAGDSSGFVDQWRDRREVADPRFSFGIGYGADSNGLGAQGGPRNPGAGDGVTYPFVGLGGVVVDRQVSGQRVYDVNADGVAHYGLYPDWIEDLRVQAGDDIVSDLARGAEAYLQMWERSVGVPGPGCRTDDDLAALRPGQTPEDVLRLVGQPVRRWGSTFTYCVADGGERTLHFDADGALVAPERFEASATQRAPAPLSRPSSEATPSPPPPVGAAASRLPHALPATGEGELLPLAAALLLCVGLVLRRAG